MTKVDVLRLMETHRIPHVPTFVLERSSGGGRGPVAAMCDLVRWLGSLQPKPSRFVTKPSHSGSCESFRAWDVSYAAQMAGAGVLVSHIRRTLERQQKPYLLVQPWMEALSRSELRHFFVGGRFVSCVHTRWRRTRTRCGWRVEARPCTEASVLSRSVPVAARIAGLLPTDSALWRVDVCTDDDGATWLVNEVEMVDACLFPDHHPEGVDIVGELARRLLELPRLGSGSLPAPTPVVPSVPVPDDGPVRAHPDAAWKAAQRTL